MKDRQKIKKQAKIRRKDRVRAKVFGTDKRPRLSVFRSLKHVYAQLIDDGKGSTIVSASDLDLRKTTDPLRPPASTWNRGERSEASKSKQTKDKTKVAFEVGKLLGQKAKKKGLKQVVFDRAGYKYHGRVKAVAEGAREAGLKF